MYDFLHWESLETPIVVGGLLGVFTGVYFLLCHIDEKVKWQLVQTRTEKCNSMPEEKAKGKSE